MPVAAKHLVHDTPVAMSQKSSKIISVERNIDIVYKSILNVSACIRKRLAPAHSQCLLLFEVKTCCYMGTNLSIPFHTVHEEISHDQAFSD